MNPIFSVPRARVHSVALAVLLVLFAASVLLVACTTGRERQFAAPSPPAAPSPTLAEGDRQFLLQVAAGAWYALAVARLGETRAIYPMVKAYAAMLAIRHDIHHEALKAIARRRNLVLPESMPRPKRETLEALTALPPELFDGRFVQQVGIADHQADILHFERASRSLADPELRAWSTRTLAMLQEHLLAAQQLPKVLQTLAARQQPHARMA